MIRIEPREMPSKLWTIGIPIISALIAILFAAIPLALAGANIFEAYSQMAKGIFGSTFAFTEMLTRATPLIFTGLAATIAFRAKLWNIGAEGQLYLGAMAAVAVGTGLIDAPSFILIPIILFTGALAGAVGMAAPTYLKTRFGAAEVVTTLLLNFIVIIFLQMMLEGPLKDPMGMGWPQSEPIVDNGVLPQLIPRMRIHTGLIIALISAGVVHLFLSKSIWGFKIRAVGENASAALHAGINVKRTFMGAAIAGLAGVSEVAGLRGYLTTDLSPGFGYTGIVVAMLAGLSPIGVVISAIFIASIFVGADTMSRAIGVSSYLADLVVALSLICVLVGGFIARYKFIRINKGNI